MKRAIAVAVLALLTSACATLSIHPVNFDAPTPDLGLSPDQKAPLNVAVVIPDPMAFRYYYTPPNDKRMDQTDQMQGERGMPLGGELARMVDQTFPNAFQHAAVLRQLPPPGQYDAVVELSVATVENVATMQHSGMLVNLGMDMWMNWKLTVLDKNNVEIYSNAADTEKRHFDVKAGFSAEPVLQALGREGGILLAGITRDAALSSRQRLLAKR